METPHLLETADVAYGNTLPGLEFRPLERARLDTGHVMGRCFAHRLLNRHNPRRRRLQYPAGRDIGSLPLTAAADRPVLFGVRFAAHGAQPDGAHMRVPEEAALHGHGLRLADAVPGFFDFTEQPDLILILFGLFLEEPAPDFRESVQLGGVAQHPAGSTLTRTPSPVCLSNNDTAYRPRLCTFIQLFPALHSVSNCTASGRHLRVSTTASNNVPSGIRAFAISTM